MTQTIEPSFSTWLKELNLFYIDSNKELNFFSWLKELNLFFYMTQRIEPSFYMTQRLEPLCKMWLENWTQRIGTFSVWLKELNLLFYMTQRLEPCSKNDSKNCNLLFLKMTQRIELLFLTICLKELNAFFDNMAQRINFFF